MSRLITFCLFRLIVVIKIYIEENRELVAVTFSFEMFTHRFIFQTHYTFDLKGRAFICSFAIVYVMHLYFVLNTLISANYTFYLTDECAVVIRVIVDALVSTTLSYSVTVYYSIFLNENMCTIVFKKQVRLCVRACHQIKL